MRNAATVIHDVKHFHLFCGLGGGAKGFNEGEARVGNMQAKFRCIGGIDSDPRSIQDFGRLTGTAGTLLDLFDRNQYIAFHGKQPPHDWREATTADIKRAAGHESPNIIFLSAPCKGFSGLLAENKSKTDKYQALNRLTERGVFLALEAFKDDPVELYVFENVPRIASRGRPLLDRIIQLFQSYNYVVSETTHDCGELGELAQSRKRFLLVARHRDKVPPFLYEPEKKTLKSVGSVLSRMPLPGDLRISPMHRIPSLQWKTWVRLAFVEAGSDWRSLNKLAVENGNLRDYLIVPDMHGGSLGVRNWDEPTGVVAGRSLPLNGAFSVADPRGFAEETHKNVYRVTPWEKSAGTITAGHGPSNGGGAVADPRPPGGPLFSKYAVTSWDMRAGTVIGGDDSGAYAVADPRHTGPAKHSNEFRIVSFDGSAMSVTGAHGSGQCVADPRQTATGFGKYAVIGFDKCAGTVIAGSTTGQGAFAVADPRSGMDRLKGDHYTTGGHYGVVPWCASSGAVSASASLDNGRWSVADPRVNMGLPASDKKMVARIQALDSTWHRPFTTLELAALQSLYEPDEHWSTDPIIQREIDITKMMQSPFILAGESDSDWRERIGNAVPPKAAKAIAGVMGVTLLLARSGETFVLSAMPIWVQPIAVALSVSKGDLS